MVTNQKIINVYSFTAATIMLDLDTPMGKAMVQQMFPFACQNLRQQNPEFNQLYNQVERDNTPNIIGTGMSASPSGFVDAFIAWLYNKGINLTDADKKKKISVFGGDAKNPQTGLSFKWSVLIYFEIEE